MKLSELTSKPKLIKVELDDAKLVEKYGETIEFWIQDRQDLDVYMSLAQLGEGADIGDIATVVRKIVLDENAKPVLGEGKMLPFDVMMKVIEESVKHLGNLNAQTSTT